MKTKTMNGLRFGVYLIGLMATGAAVHAASFDCKRSQTQVEQLICASPEISKLDEDLARAYGIAVQANPKAEEIKDIQKKWLQQRNACQSVDCLAVTYQKRIKDLSEIERIREERVGDWTYRDGEGRREPLCQALLQRLNRYDRGESLENRCALPVIASHPEFKAPPWEELDPKQHEDLIVKLLKYSEEGPQGYFGQPPGVTPKNLDSYYRSRATRLLEEGVRLRVLRIRLVSYLKTQTGSVVSATPGLQSVVQLYQSMSDEISANYCAGKPKPHSVKLWKITYIFTQDLKSPDPLVDPGTNGIVSGHDIVFFDNKPLLIGEESIWRDGQIGLEGVCSFEFVKGAR